MAIQSKFYTPDGTTLNYPQTKHIASKLHVRVLLQDMSNVWTPLDGNNYDLIYNSVVLYSPVDASVYKSMEVRVADSENELTDNTSDIAVVASIHSDITTVANNDTAITNINAQIVPNIAEILLADSNAATATTKAKEASVSATNAATSEVNAATSATNAEASAASIGHAITDTIATLRASTITPLTIYVTGYHAKGDGAFGSHFFEWDATSTEADNGGTIIALTGVTTGRYKLKYDGAVDVKWFGAVGDGVIDDSGAVSKCIASSLAAGINTIHFSSGKYYFEHPVEVILDYYYGFRFTGDSTAAMITGGVTGGTIISGSAGIESLFIFTKTNLGEAGGYSFECDHISFESSGLGTTGAATAIKNKIAGYPARPFIVKNCDFRGFDKAIVSDLSEAVAITPSITTGICQVIIRENSIIGCGKALYGTGGHNAIMDLVFEDNVSENGGAILITAGSLGGTFSIQNNLLEGNYNAIALGLGLATGTIANNYFEANTGYIYNVYATNLDSTLNVYGNYIYNSGTATVNVSTLVLTSLQRLPIASAVYSMLRPDSTYNNSDPVHALDITAVGRSNFIKDSHLLSDKINSLGGAIVTTQTGSLSRKLPNGSIQNVASINGAGSYITPTGLSPLTGDVIVFGAWVRRTTATTPTLYPIVYTYAYTNGISITTSFSLDQPINKWEYVQWMGKYVVDSNGSPRIKFHSTAEIELGSVTSYVIPSADISTYKVQVFDEKDSTFELLKTGAINTEVYSTHITGNTSFSKSVAPSSFNNRCSTVTIRYSIGDGSTTSFFYDTGVVHSEGAASYGGWTEIFSTAKTVGAFGTFDIVYNTTTGSLDISKTAGSGAAGGTLSIEVSGHTTNNFI